ncbi:hypothetical protein C2U68_17330 [Methylomonas koyamae]|nr:hypothetical protein C2U68_17330 [Methylomonas koyamae]
MLGSSLLSAGMSAYQASEQASAAKKQAQYQAQVDANNAKMAEWARSDALQRGEIEAQRSMQSRAQLIGRQRAALAANGVELNQGSALDLLTSTEYLGQQEVDTIQNNALREAWGYSNQAAEFRSGSAFADWRARNTSPGKAALLSGASSLISSASQFAMMKAR